MWQQSAQGQSDTDGVGGVNKGQKTQRLSVFGNKFVLIINARGFKQWRDMA